MIEPNKKQYKTRGGSQWRYYGSSGNEIHGATMNHWGEWDIGAWGVETGKCLSNPDVIGMDLVEVKPRIKKEYWVNLDGDAGIQGWYTSEDLSYEYRLQSTKARVKIFIDCEEGEGL